MYFLDLDIYIYTVNFIVLLTVKSGKKLRHKSSARAFSLLCIL